MICLLTKDIFRSSVQVLICLLTKDIFRSSVQVLICLLTKDIFRSSVQGLICLLTKDNQEATDQLNSLLYDKINTALRGSDQVCWNEKLLYLKEIKLLYFWCFVLGFRLFGFFCCCNQAKTIWTPTPIPQSILIFLPKGFIPYPSSLNKI